MELQKIISIGMALIPVLSILLAGYGTDLLWEAKKDKNTDPKGISNNEGKLKPLVFPDSSYGSGCWSLSRRSLFIGALVFLIIVYK